MLLQDRSLTRHAARGRAIAVPPPTYPAWRVGKTVNEWFQLAGTAYPSGLGAQYFSGMAANADDLVSGAAGGHSDSGDNSVQRIRLTVDVPAWVLLKAASAATINTDFYVDGSPTSRHIYLSSHIVDDSLWLIAVKSAYGGLANEYPRVVRFDLNANSWDAAAAWPDALGTGTGMGAFTRPGTGEIWSVAGTSVYKFTQAGGQVLLQDFGGVNEFSRLGCWDPVGNQAVTIGFGDNVGGGTDLRAYVITAAGTSRTAISFAANSGYTTFAAEGPQGVALEYDSYNDRFAIFPCTAGNTGRVYWITPNRSGGPWTVDILSLGAGTSNPPALPNSGNNGGPYNKFRYFAALRGFAYAAPEGISFLPTAV